ncbi:MAG: alcohol dehydrogenase catalytic domain-containing protein [Firmicutes bacterium]|nr:alcohol dehydrogenase catalytic domain-containing protein [Bacillota bacterium]
MAKAAVLRAPQTLEIEEFALPAPEPESGLLRVEVAGVCTGTDTKLYHGKLDNPWPLIPGHEIVGVVEALGPGLAQTTGVQVGTRVILRGAQCGRCEACRRGEGRFCPANPGYGLRTPTTVSPGLWGGYAEYVYLAPGAVLEPVPEGVSAEQALMATVFANGLTWVLAQGGLRAGESLLVQGVGQQGLMGILAGRLGGASPIIAVGLGTDRARLHLAKQLGADWALAADQDAVGEVVAEVTDGQGVDLLLEVSGSPRGLIQALPWIRTGGRVVLASLSGKGVEVPVPLDEIVWRQIRVQGVYSKSATVLKDALRILRHRRLPITELITHRLPLQEAALAMELAGRGGEVVKVVLLP